MASISKRIDALEKAAVPPGKMVVVGLGEFDWTQEQLDAAMASAKLEAGPNDYVVGVTYGDWPPEDRE